MMLEQNGEKMMTFGPNDMVKADCGDCKGCSDCCHGMGDSITLDPYDIVRLKRVTGKTFEQMIGFEIQLGMKGYLILPYLRMKEQGNCCSFLTEEGRCAIHAERPGICRLFPLGRVYENGAIRYFLQGDECKNKARTKIKVKKWVQVPEGKEYEDFVLNWHAFLERTSEAFSSLSAEELRERNMAFLRAFYFRSYTDFFCEISEQMKGESNG